MNSFRHTIYTELAKRALFSKVHWAILHGIEGYPETIGRDLDVCCASKSDAQSLLALFKSCLEEANARWIIIPHPIWGRRIFGITDTFEVAELHVFGEPKVANLRFPIDWKNLQLVEGLFPVDPFANYIKGALLPAIAGDANWLEKSKVIHAPNDAPWWLRRCIKKVSQEEKLKKLDLLALFAGYALSHPLRSFQNTLRWAVTKARLPYSASCPIYCVADKKLVSFVEKRLGEIFSKVICGDYLSEATIRRHLAKQHFVYLTTPRQSSLSQVDLKPEDEEHVCQAIVNGFADFNAHRRAL